MKSVNLFILILTLISISSAYAQQPGAPAQTTAASQPSAPQAGAPQAMPGQMSPTQNQPGANQLGPSNLSDGPMVPIELPRFSGASGLSRRDPFKLPEYIIIKLRQKNALTVPVGSNDDIEPIRRWPLASYQLVGIIWDVKKPKAMFMDRVNAIHMVQVNEFIGNAKGVVVAIQSGAVTVLEGKIPQIIKLKK